MAIISFIANNFGAKYCREKSSYPDRPTIYGTTILILLDRKVKITAERIKLVQRSRHGQ